MPKNLTSWSWESSDDRVIVLSGCYRIYVQGKILRLTWGADGTAYEMALSHTDLLQLRRIVCIGFAGDITREARAMIDAANYTATGGRRKTTDRLSLLELKPNGEILSMSYEGAWDSTTRQAQYAIRDTDMALHIIKWLLTEKFIGHEETTPNWNADEYVRLLNSRQTIKEIRQDEAHEAFVYFRRWRNIKLRRDHRTIPIEWESHGGRPSPLGHGRNNLNAVNPWNACLNLALEIAKTQMQIACHVNGLDPYLGVLHAGTGIGARPLCYDLVEPVRPHVEGYVRWLFDTEQVGTRDFYQPEKHSPLTRVMPDLRKQLHERAMDWYSIGEPYAADLIHMLPIKGPKPQRKKRDEKLIGGTKKKTVT